MRPLRKFFTAPARTPRVEFCDACSQVSTPATRAAVTLQRHEQQLWLLGVPPR